MFAEFYAYHCAQPRDVLSLLGIYVQEPIAPPVIPATWQTEVQRVKIQGQPGKIVRETPSLK
jgi:hypothetical protein